MITAENQNRGYLSFPERVPVLIVGAGGAGLSLSLLLLQQGIHPLLIERREDISWVPRARNLNFRALEVFRGLGLEAEVHAAGASLSQAIFKEHLNDKRTEKIIDPITLTGHSEATSPEPFGWYCPQSELEPLMRTAAQQRGGDVRYGTELVSFIQDDTGVMATVKERSTGKLHNVQSDYLIAADGAHSRIRETLGVSAKGLGVLPEYFVFVYFRAPWKPLIAGYEKSDAFMIKNADVQGIFLQAGEDRGIFLLMYRPAKGESVADFTAGHCKDLIQKAIGEEIAVEILDIAPWQPAESVADRFQQGRVFLAGDSAHTMPAYLGLGVNTAIQSAQNLAWKLAAVLKGRASPLLLATYQAERHPVGWFAAEQSLTGPGAAWLPKTDHEVLLPKEKALPYFFPIVGYRYRSRAILTESVESSPRDAITLLDRQELTGVPGTRVPHLWLERQGKRISTLDLFNGQFVLLTGANGNAWCEAAAAVNTGLGIEISAYRIGPNADLIDLEHGWPGRMGTSSWCRADAA